MIEVFTAIGIATVIVAGTIAVTGTLLLIRAWWLSRQDLKAAHLVVRKPLGDCICDTARAPSGFEFRIPYRQCTIHGHEWTA